MDYRKLIWLTIILFISSCDFIGNDSCMPKWSFWDADSKLSFYYKGQPVSILECSIGQCYLIAKPDLENECYIMWYDYNILLIDSKNDTIYHQIVDPNHHRLYEFMDIGGDTIIEHCYIYKDNSSGNDLGFNKPINVKIDVINGHYVYSTPNAFLLFDNELNIRYCHLETIHKYLHGLAEEEISEILGEDYYYKINYYIDKQKNEIILKYYFLEPFFPHVKHPANIHNVYKHTIIVD